MSNGPSSPERLAVIGYGEQRPLKPNDTADGRNANRRVVVFDKAGKFLRQWGRQATDEETQQGVPGVFAEVVHCIAMSNAGLIYVCDRQGNRVQVFQKDGTFVGNIPIPNKSGKLPEQRGTAW